MSDQVVPPPTQVSDGTQPTTSQTNHVYQKYGLHRHQGNVRNIKELDKKTLQEDRAKHGALGGAVKHALEGTSEIDHRLDSTAKTLTRGLDLRDAPQGVDAVYQGISHETLYQSVTEGVNPSAVTSTSDTWLGIGNKLGALQSTVAKAIASTEVSWTGKAAEQARQSIAKLGNQSGAAGQSAQLAGVLTARQAEALTSAKNTVPPPPKPPYDPQAAQQHMQTITDPVQLAKQASQDHAAAAAQKAAHQQAAHVVQQYDRELAHTSASMPAFAPAPKVVKPGGPPTTHVPTVPPPVSTTRTSTPTSPTNPTDPISTPTLPTQNPTTQQPPLTTTTSSSTFAPTVGQPGPGLGSGPGQLGLSGPGLPGEGFPGGGFLPGVGGGFGGPGGGGSSGAGRGFGGAAGEADAGGSARSGVGAGAGASAEEAGMAERFGARGASGGMGGMGAGRGQRGKPDAEHKRPSWLVETDDGIFGADQLTAPPVIGE